MELLHNYANADTNVHGDHSQCACCIDLFKHVSEYRWILNVCSLGLLICFSVSEK